MSRSLSHHRTMPKPNFLIIGAAKSGTTSLFNYLKQHPKVFGCPVKEPRFFAFEGDKKDFKGPGDDYINRTAVTNLKDYQALFSNMKQETAAGEASIDYLASPAAAGRIHDYFPRMRIIVILRDPAQRAYSNYLHQVRFQNEPLADFAEALRQEQLRREAGWAPFWFYIHQGFYYQHLKRYFAFFHQSLIRVYTYEEWQGDNLGVLRELFQFLNVSDDFVPDMSRYYQKGGVPISQGLQRILLKAAFPPNGVSGTFPGRLKRGLASRLLPFNLRPGRLEPETRAALIQTYREDILRLQDLIGRDLSRWLQVETGP